MAGDDLREREEEYLRAAKLVAKCEQAFSEEFLLAKVHENTTDRMAEHMATVKVGRNLSSARALEVIARRRLNASEPVA